MGSKETMSLTENGDMACGCGTNTSPLPLAIATVPCQKWSEPYELATALTEGTLFPELNKPFFMGGDRNVR